MPTPFVTVLINTYNYGAYVGEAIQSVLDQDFPSREMEILVVDDGSTDDTPAQLRKFQSKVRYVRKENEGQASAINLGAQLAAGELIAMLDADDLWAPTKLSKVVSTTSQHPSAGAIIHPLHYWRVGENVLFPDPYFRPSSTSYPVTRKEILAYTGAPTSALCVRKKCLQQILPIPQRLRIMMDAYIHWLLPFVAPVIALDEYLGRYRIHGRNSWFSSEDYRIADAHRASDQVRIRVECNRALIEEMETWASRSGSSRDDPTFALMLDCQRIMEREFRFWAQGASRLEFLRHLRSRQAILRPDRPPRYKLFQLAGQALALVLGYASYTKLQYHYSRSERVKGLRSKLFPDGRSSHPGHSGPGVPSQMTAAGPHRN